ncbi:MAG: hypothetical protein DRP51_00195 [Candidatus Zixiibacteriota bacterium]|nr:MAG: hypothetical protein DRP51_00195 [candidate division Zixibacteria bacterium]HHI02504.1 AMIN domain-containing protein [candidate division Zixibacteria bacterium]
MNIKISVYSLSILLLAALAVSADDAKVSRLGLSPQSGETVLRIDVSGPFQFVHETAEAKDGKPFRLVIDIFPAIHDLSQKDFFDLPKTMISSIRTSQYSVKPEKVVRIVCDLDQTAMYRVEKKGSSVYLYLPDKKSGSFTSWSSPLKITRPAKAPVTVADVSTQKKDKPVKKVVKKKVVKKVKTATSPSAGTPEKAKVTLAKHYQAKSSDFIDHDKFLSTQSKPKKAQPVVSVAGADSEPAKKATAPKKVVVKKSGQPKPLVKSKSTVTTVAAPPKEKVAKKAIVKVDLPKPEPKSDQPVQEYTMLKKTAPASKKTKVETAKTSSVVKKPAAKSNEVATTKVKETEESKRKQKPTSRFRRKPTFPTKLKGTIVAEFPTRIVMKYRPGTGRDPFKNLLTDAKGNNSPIQKKIPDVETAKLVGILESSDGKKRALLEDHDGYGYILKSGDKVKKGYVGKIYSDKAYFKLFEYGWSRTVALYMSLN